MPEVSEKQKARKKEEKNEKRRKNEEKNEEKNGEKKMYNNPMYGGNRGDCGFQFPLILYSMGSGAL